MQNASTNIKAGGGKAGGSEKGSISGIFAGGGEAGTLEASGTLEGEKVYLSSNGNNRIQNK